MKWWQLLAQADAPAYRAPSGLTASVSGSTVSLAWSSPAGACAPTAYVLEAGSAPGLANLANSNVGNTVTFTATGVGAGTYYARVRALNGAGQSAPSNEVTVVVGGGTTGRVMFWTDANLGPLEVTINGAVAGTITQYYPSSTPGCGASGAVTVNLPVGSQISYSATCVDRDPFTGQSANVFLGLLDVAPGCTPIRFTSQVPCSSPTAGRTINFSGTVRTTPTIPFGGPPYCAYTIVLSNVASSLTVVGDAVTQAQVTVFAVENAVTSCGANTLIPPNTHVYRLAGGRVSGSLVSIDYTPDVANRPRATLTFNGTISPDRSFITGTLAWHRIDRPSPLDWRVSTPIALGRMP